MDIDQGDYESGVLIDQLSADLNLIIDKDCLLAYPISGEGFCSMWAGCRANYGVNFSKVAFEINLEDYCECPDLPKCSESEPHMIRVGWSVAESSNQLGEDGFSFAFCNNGKKCTNNVFEDYGETFEKGDSVASYIDFETDPTKIFISYSKNGIDLGPAFTINKSELTEKYEKEFSIKKSFNIVKNEESVNNSNVVFFPHVLTKNIVFEMNFGQRVSLIGDEPFAPIKSDYLLIQKIPIEKRTCSDHASLKKDEESDVEAILLVGLPGVGKTEWAIEYSKKNPDKAYYILGVSSILDKMKNEIKKPTNAEIQKEKLENEKKIESLKNGESKSQQAAVTKTQMELLDKVLKCMNVLIEVATQSNRNIILDQPNVYESARRRKTKMFEKFKCRAVVIIPSDEVYSKISKQNEQAKIDSHKTLVTNMKANFTLPTVGDIIKSVEFVGLNETESNELVKKYNQEESEKRVNVIVEKRLAKKLNAKQNVSRVLNNSPGSFKFGPRNHQLPFTNQPNLYNDMTRNRFGSNFQNSMNNKRFMNNSYYNQSIRMNNNRFPSPMNQMIPNYGRPQLFINNVIPTGFGIPGSYNIMPQARHHAPGYNLNHSWPAATSTEIWNQQSIPVTTSNWDPALPISNAAQMSSIPYMGGNNFPPK